MGIQKAARGSCAIIADHNQMQVIKKKIVNVNRKKIGKEILLTDITEFYQTGIVYVFSK